MAGISQECLDFVNRCLKFDRADRLGFGFGIAEVKAHGWFDGFDWKSLADQTLKSEYY